MTAARNNIREVLRFCFMYSSLIIIEAVLSHFQRHMQFVLLPSAFHLPATMPDETSGVVQPEVHSWSLKAAVN